MLAYAIRRVLTAIPVLIVSTFVVFLVVSSSGNPLDNYYGQQHTLSPEAFARLIATKKHQYHLDVPLVQRYWDWLSGLLLHGNWGPSTQNYNIETHLFSSLWVTVRLVILAMLIAMILAIVVGTISAAKQYSGIDYTFTFAGFLFLSLPVFFFGDILKVIAIWVNDHWHTNIATLSESFTSIGDTFNHMLLPTLTLALTQFAGWSRFNRASVLEVLNSDYVRLARAKGLSRRRVMVRHALRTALIPFTTVTALDLAAIFGGAVITERVFQWRGMGTLLLDAITANDTYVVLAWLLITAVIVIAFNLIADLLYGVLDPRIRYE